jgi:hypothetical protein
MPTQGGFIPGEVAVVYGVTVSVADLVTPKSFADMVTAVDEVTAVVVMVKVCDTVAPAGTLTVAGTAATGGLELDKVML